MPLKRSNPEVRGLWQVLQDRYVSPEILKTFLSFFFDVPLVDGIRVPIEPEALDAIPERMAIEFGFLPLRYDSGSLMVAVDGPYGLRYIPLAQSLLGVQIKPVVYLGGNLRTDIVQEYVRHKRGNRRKTDRMSVRPVFGVAEFRVVAELCLVLCPFREPFDTIYSDHIRPAVEKASMRCKRADEIYGTRPIIDDVWELINQSRFVIADVTAKNPNVLYELGIAHTVGKPAIILAQNIDDVPFDLRHIRLGATR